MFKQHKRIESEKGKSIKKKSQISNRMWKQCQPKINTNEEEEEEKGMKIKEVGKNGIKPVLTTIS